MVAIKMYMDSQHCVNVERDTHCSVQGIWEKLASWYDLKNLDEREDAVLNSPPQSPNPNIKPRSLNSNSTFQPFSLPPDFQNMMFERRLAPEGSKSPPLSAFSVKSGRSETRGSTILDSEDPRSSPVPSGMRTGSKGRKSAGGAAGGRSTRASGRTAAARKRKAETLADENEDEAAEDDQEGSADEEEDEEDEEEEEKTDNSDDEGQEPEQEEEGGLGAGRVVETLARTGGFNPKVVRRRLFETTQFVLEVTRSIGDIMPVGMEEEKEGQTGEQQKDTEINKSSPKPNTPQSQASPLSNKTSNPPSAHLGFKSSLRVRLLHSSVRRRILQLTQRHSSYYQTTEHGIPINTLHNIGTLGTFSTLLIYRSLPRQGIRLTRGEITSYISLWRLIAHYLTGSALITSYFSHAESARLIMEVLLMTEVTPTRLSRTLTSSILTSIANHPPAYPTQRFLEASIRWCNGNAISNHLLGPQHPPFYYKILVAGQCLFFIATCSPLLHLRWWRWWCPYSSNTNNKLTEWILAHDANRIHRIRSLSWKAIVESKWGLQGQTTDFAFKYIPGIDFVEVANTTSSSSTTTTTEEGYVDDEKRKFSPTTKKNFLSSSRLRERRAVMAMEGFAG
ncbi:putative tat pathway signal sequence [Phaeomoniella chlamydospora]|uniref:Putative tat pathway signal sequence n=1 Tax=Phaeomoniella chlamydospora TaxID=158046 RepID=A0A0G2EPS3_PHACM|nr:putative tat pathway signal sequence [Phaeomoniella chlamydospora]